MKYTLDQIIKVMESKNHMVFEADMKEYNLNLVGIRAANGKVNQFDDLFNVFWRYKGQWNHEVFPITTDPGLYWLQNPLNVEGTGILKEGQYIGLWKIGRYKGQYLALVQQRPCMLYRDRNKDGKIDFNGPTQKEFFGVDFHHAGKDSAIVDRWSAGCQVTKCEKDFDRVMELVNAAANNFDIYFTYTLLNETDFKSLS